MPLHARIYINDREIEQVHIGRIEGDENPDTINTYQVIVGDEPTSTDEWMGGTTFTHRYGDGALVCIQKAIEAYEK